MKTTNYNENCRYGQNIEVSISSWENDPSIHVSATERNLLRAFRHRLLLRARREDAQGRRCNLKR